MITLYNDDCLNVLKQMQDNSVDLVVMDPPYDVHVTNKLKDGEITEAFFGNMQSIVDANIHQGYDIVGINNELVRIMKNINIYIWCNKAQIMDYFKYYVENLKCRFEILTWHKSNAIPSFSNKYLSDTEYLLYFKSSGAYCYPQNYDDARTFYIAPINQADKKVYEHPTIKPLDFTERIIKNSSSENDLVLDPFMGSGTTGVACKKLNRQFIGVEINKEYYDIAQLRINNQEIKKVYKQTKLF